MNRPALFALPLIVLACSPSPAPAWNKAGHMVSGAIAYHVLKADSPETVKAVVAILKRHLQFATLWEEKLAGLSEEN